MDICLQILLKSIQYPWHVILISLLCVHISNLIYSCSRDILIKRKCYYRENILNQQACVIFERSKNALSNNRRVPFALRKKKKKESNFRANGLMRPSDICVALSVARYNLYRYRNFSVYLQTFFHKHSQILKIKIEKFTEMSKKF